MHAPLPTRINQKYLAQVVTTITGNVRQTCAQVIERETGIIDWTGSIVMSDTDNLTEQEQDARNVAHKLNSNTPERTADDKRINEINSEIRTSLVRELERNEQLENHNTSAQRQRAKLAHERATLETKNNA